MEGVASRLVFKAIGKLSKSFQNFLSQLVSKKGRKEKILTLSTFTLKCVCVLEGLCLENHNVHSVAIHLGDTILHRVMIWIREIAKDFWKMNGREMEIQDKLRTLSSCMRFSICTWGYVLGGIEAILKCCNPGPPDHSATQVTMLITPWNSFLAVLGVGQGNVSHPRTSKWVTTTQPWLLQLPARGPPRHAKALPSSSRGRLASSRANLLRKV